MANWDEDSPQLRANLAEVLQDIVRAAKDREIPTLESARKWQALAMRGLDVPDLRFVGAFRGEPGLKNIRARVGANWGVDPADVARDLAAFQETLQMHSVSSWILNQISQHSTFKAIRLCILQQD